MADFRKCFLAVAVLALVAIPAFAQGGGVICNANGGVPPIVRAEGLTELVGDVVLNCTGGVPTNVGAQIPLVNIQIFLSTPITSRLTNTSGSQWSEAMLMIDEPYPTGGPVANPVQRFCPNATGCPMPGIGVVVAGPTYTGPFSGVEGRPNVWQGQQVATNSIAFLGVPFDAPGTQGGTRIIRITNIRTAPGAPSSSLIPQPVVEYISITGATSVPVNNPQQIVGYSQFGLDQNATLVTGASTFSTCNSSNSVSGGSLTGEGSQLYISGTEGFASSFKVRNISQVPQAVPPGTPINNADLPQNVPGAVYNTESGFYLQSIPGQANDVETGGLASNGSRIMFTLSAPPTGATVYVPNVLPLFQKGNLGNVTGFAVLLPNADANGATGGFSGDTHSAYFSGIPATASVEASAAQLGNAFGDDGEAAFTPVSTEGPGRLPAAAGTPGLVAIGSAGVVVYEIVQTQTSAMEQLSLPLVVSYGGFGNAPITGLQATGAVNFAPISPNETPATAAASTTLPIPRFVRTGGPGNTFMFQPCFCNILFPYVTTQQGYETGIAVSNTSVDPFGTTPSTGTVTINYYGMNAPVPAAGSTGFTTNGGPNATCPGDGCVPAGGQLVFTVGGGGGLILSPTAGTSPTAQALPAATNFQGYIIAQSRFRYCHGFAFITCAGCGATAPGASEAYLGLILDAPTAPRSTGNAGEALMH